MGSRWISGTSTSVTSHTQSALDAAALAAGRAAQLNSGTAVTAASAAATAYFNQAKPQDVVTSTLAVLAELRQHRIHGHGDLVGEDAVPERALLGRSQGRRRRSPDRLPDQRLWLRHGDEHCNVGPVPERSLHGQLVGGTNVEMSLMLDVTGSMCSPARRSRRCKSAAKDLIDIVVWADQSKYYSRVALAPFAEAVNVGTTLAPLVRGTDGQHFGDCADIHHHHHAERRDAAADQAVDQIPESERAAARQCTWTISTKCVTERIGNDAYTDAAPTGTSTYVGKGYFGTSTTTSCGVGNYTDTEVNSIQPLSNDTTMLKRRIDKLDTGGSTAGHLGTAWAWYLLSPNWNYRVAARPFRRRMPRHPTAT